MSIKLSSKTSGNKSAPKPKCGGAYLQIEDFKKVEKAPIKLDKYAMRLRMKYGYTHERVREKIQKRITGQEANEFKDFQNPEENIETALIFYRYGSAYRTSLSDRISA